MLKTLEILNEKKYLTIGDLSKITAIPAYSIRHWETQFKLLNPVRTKNGHRRYTKEHAQRMFEIKDLLYKEKMTLEGIKKYFSGRKNFPEKSGQNTQTDNKINRETLSGLTKISKELSDILKEW